MYSVHPSHPAGGYGNIVPPPYAPHMSAYGSYGMPPQQVHQGAPPGPPGVSQNAPFVPAYSYYDHFSCNSVRLPVPGVPPLPAGPSLLVPPQLPPHQQPQCIGAPMTQLAPLAPAPPEEVAVSGGVSSHLDYDVDVMAKFLSGMVYGIMFPEDNSGSFPTSYRLFVGQLLHATRLPLATVILAMVYASNRCALGNLPHDSTNRKLLVLALLLANKFNDDHTFKNNSWSEATGIPVAEISLFEADWLKSISWSLHLNANDLKGWDRWCDCWRLYSRRVREQSQSPLQTGSKASSRNSPSSMRSSSGSSVATTPNSSSSETSPVSSPTNHRSMWFDKQRQHPLNDRRFQRHPVQPFAPSLDYGLDSYGARYSNSKFSYFQQSFAVPERPQFLMGACSQQAVGMQPQPVYF